MWVFVDESGDPGMELGSGTSDQFVVVAVLFESREDADACDRRIETLRAELGLSARSEFKFTKSSDRVREAFMKAVAPHNFFYVAAVIDKGRLGSDLFATPGSFYQYVTRSTFQLMKPRLAGAYVEIDKSGGRDFGRRLSKYLSKIMRERDGRSLIKRVKMAKSAGNNLLQLADMVAGALARSFKPDKKNYEVCRKLVALRELEVKHWP
jgi:hypothetical protein